MPQELLVDEIRTPVRSEPHIALEEIDSGEVVVRIAATPAAEADGPRLADEILAAIAPTRAQNACMIASATSATAVAKTTASASAQVAAA